MLNREIAERLALIMQDVYPFDMPSVGEILDAIHATERDLENGGSETIAILNGIIADYEGNDDVIVSATELVDLINN